MPDALASFDWMRGLAVHRGWFVPWLLFLMWGYGLGVVLGYHRVLTHRAAKLNRFLEYFLITFALPAGTPIQWIGNHRHHHAVSDTPDDEHSPTHHGFWTAQAGWYLHTKKTLPAVLYTFAGPLRAVFDAFWRPRTNQQYVHLARDVAADPYYAWISRPGPYAVIVLAHAVLPLAFTWLLWGAPFAALYFALAVAFYGLGDGVNSLCHMFGRRDFDSRDDSRNVGWLALITFGDSWHNGHHAFPNSAKAGLLPGQLDAAWLWCRLFEKLGLARDLRVPRAQDIEAKRRRADRADARSDLKEAA